MYFIDNNTLYFQKNNKQKNKSKSIMADNTTTRIYTINDIEHQINGIPTTLPSDIEDIFKELVLMPASNDPDYIGKTQKYEQSRYQHVRAICNGFMHIIINIEKKMNADSNLSLSSRIATIQTLQDTKILINTYKHNTVPNNPLVQAIRNIVSIYNKIKIHPDYKVAYAQYLPIFLKLKNKMKEFYLLAEGFPYGSRSISNQNLSNNYVPAYMASNIFKQSSSSSSSNTNNMNFYAEDDVSF